jgi:ABC-type lipoprotein release transport system permease subunit
MKNGQKINICSVFLTEVIGKRLTSYFQTWAWENWSVVKKSLFRLLSMEEIIRRTVSNVIIIILMASFYSISK